MTLWLSNLTAYSVQLAVLVASGAVLMSVLRVAAPRASLRFWQAIFIASVSLPTLQLLVNRDAPSAVFGSGVLWSADAASASLPSRMRLVDADVATLVVVALAIGAAMRLAWVALGLMRLRAMRAASEPALALESIALPLRRELGVSADIRISDTLDVPATFGMRPPAVLLPRHVCSLAPAVQRAVLCHELIHVQRRDWRAVVLEEAWCALLWFHPAARALASRLGLARETLVDAATIAHTRDRRAYAAALLEFSSPRLRLLGASALIGRRHLEQRIALIAQEASMSRSTLVLRLAVATSAVTVVTLAAATFMPLAATLQAQAEKVYKPGDGVTLPRVVSEVRPRYTAAAMQEKIEGRVVTKAVVLASGDVGDVVVTESLDQEHGLDEQAVIAVRQWKFEPGTRDGQPVAVEVAIEMTFRLK